MNFQEMLNDLDDAFLPCARDTVRQLSVTGERKVLTDEDVMGAVADAIAERRIALTAKPASPPLLYCSTPELCISTEEFACQASLAPQQIRREYLNTGFFRNVSPLPLYDGSLAWPLYRVDEYLKQRTAQTFSQ